MTASKRCMCVQFTSGVPGQLTVLDNNERLTIDLGHRKIRTSLILCHPYLGNWYVKLAEIIVTF